MSKYPIITASAFWVSAVRFEINGGGDGRRLTQIHPIATNQLSEGREKEEVKNIAAADFADFAVSDVAAAAAANYGSL